MVIIKESFLDIIYAGRKNAFALYDGDTISFVHFLTGVKKKKIMYEDKILCRAASNN